MSSTPTYTSRDQIPTPYKWDLTRIYPDWGAWRADLAELASGVDRYVALRGRLAEGADRLLEAYRLDDTLGQMAYKVWFYTSLLHDEDQRDNEVNARRQEVAILFARWRQGASWFAPELLAIPLDTVRRWMDENPSLAVYRFAIEELYRQQEHVLDAKGEHLLSLAGRLTGAPGDAYAALSTADIKFPTIQLSTGEDLTVTPGAYRALIATNRVQADRARAYFAQLEPWETSANTYAALYAGVLERDWFLARARGYPSCLHAALHGNDIPTGVVERLISAARAGVGPVRRYHQLRRRALGLDRYGPYDTALPIVASDRRYPYDEAVAAVEASLAPLGEAWVADARAALRGRYIDVYETPGKRSGAYSAPVYGVHPYMLMNYNDTLDAVFTLAHELGHTMHTLLSHRSQPFVYAGYTIFVAEVPSTLSESLLLEHLLRLTADPRERIVLLQHAIDEIVGTFYTQAMFAEFELRAHQLVEQDQPITADVLGDLYLGILRDWNGDAVDFDARARSSWARVSHFFGTPFYVYQYATCFASSAQLVSALTQGSEADRAAAIDRYMTLLKAGGSDHPMQLLRRAGVDLSAPEPVEAVVRHMDELVTRLEAEWDALAG